MTVVYYFQERIRELNLKARQFADTFIAIQTGNGHAGHALSRNSAIHDPKSLQVSIRGLFVGEGKWLEKNRCHRLFYNFLCFGPRSLQVSVMALIVVEGKWLEKNRFQRLF